MERRVQALEEAVSTLTVYIKRQEKKHKQELEDLFYAVNHTEVRLDHIERDSQQLDYVNKSCNELRKYVDRNNVNLNAVLYVLGKKDPSFQENLDRRIKQHEAYVAKRMKEFDKIVQNFQY
jgi:rubrerythrin